MFHALRNRRLIHHTEVFLDDTGIIEFPEEDRMGIFLRVLAIDAVDASRLKHDIRLDLQALAGPLPCRW